MGMYNLKQVPEDFIVKEISNIKLEDNGKYSYFILKKKNYNTLNAIQAISNKLGINIKNIGFAGNKDKNAVTEQAISICNGNDSMEGMELKDISLKYLGKGNEEIYLGSLKGNEFIVTIRNLTKGEIKYIKEKAKNKEIAMPNYFGEQRLSNNNALIGKAIIKSSFKEAAELILKSNSDYNKKIEQHLQKQKNDFVGALKIIPFKLLKLYIHSYQSLLFNKALEQYIKAIQNNSKKTIGNKNKKINENFVNVKIPIIGFATEISGKEIEKTMKKLKIFSSIKSMNTFYTIKKVMEEESIGLRDFIVRAIPGLSSEGGERDIFTKVNDFGEISSGKDDLNEGKEKIIVKFSLPKGSYATVLIEYLFIVKGTKI